MYQGMRASDGPGKYTRGRDPSDQTKNSDNLRGLRRTCPMTTPRGFPLIDGFTQADGPLRVPWPGLFQPRPSAATATTHDHWLRTTSASGTTATAGKLLRTSKVNDFALAENGFSQWRHGHGAQAIADEQGRRLRTG